ncbi:putative oxidoreductase (secreted protein) [Nostocoides japonicum T1-X7]|uniref:Putative oxidoreductase ( secreted protein) n=1 Tax=Nostocoides japonicum T1-X7 TaxID=1194083 RepID=A0A077LVY6_9MICO|nr:hypothetical protein [Tetrasphaera japonica]CCH76144.1 putative oxidoreductase (secreted protein) [Tetrasphaera japonica T1-X7]
MTMARRRRGAAVVVAGAALVLATSTEPALSAPTDPATSAASAAPATSAAPARLAWTPVATGSAQDFRGVDAVSRSVVWTGGTHGRVLRTIDAGRHWTDVRLPGAKDVYVRDIEATSARHAVVMTVPMGDAGPEGNRVYVTDDGGRTWASVLTPTDPAGYFDCMAFSTARRGYLVGDPVGGRFALFVTVDGGHRWRAADRRGMPRAAVDEFGFAAGGGCMSALGSSVWFGTGGRSPGRVYRSVDDGHAWIVRDTTIAGAFPGVLAVQFRDSLHGIAVGGDLDDLASAAHTAARTDDGGRTWHEARRQPRGPRSGAVWVPGLPVAIAVGPNGSDITLDGGRSWRPIDHAPWNTVSCSADLTCYAVGDAGLVARLRLVP